MNWIKARLNKDNFWNMMFLVGTALGIAFSEWIMTFHGLNLLGWIMLINSLVFIPMLAIVLNPVSCANGKTFLNKEGKIINTKLLKLFILILPVTAASIAWLPDLFIAIFSNDTIDSFILTTVFLSFFIAPVLFFILINCPISILFNKFLWHFSIEVGSQQKNFVNPNVLHKSFMSKRSSINPKIAIRNSFNSNIPSYYRRVERRGFYSSY